MNWLEWIQEKIRQNEQKGSNNLIITNGTYRLPTLGHYKSFEDMRALADNFNSDSLKAGRVYIFVDSKERVQKIKPNSFCLDDQTRIDLIEQSKYIDKAFIFNSIEHLQQEVKAMWSVNKMLYNKLIYCKGGDYQDKELDMKKFIESIGGEVILLPFHKGYSSTQLVQELQGMK